MGYDLTMLSLKTRYAELLSRGAKKSAWGSPAPSSGANLTSEIVNLILAEAVTARASDIHLEPRHGQLMVRFRIDGKLYEVLEILESSEINVLPRLKILANLPTDSVSSRKALDGRFSMEIAGKKFDFRIATFPTLLGDSIAIRILNKDAGMVNLTKIGLNAADQARLERTIQRQSGLVVVSGPTGGGKTTTLYSLLGRLHTSSVNIVTLEDPVEYQIDGINQCDIKNKGNEEFISGLKAVLRQDPDIILIGEIRDHESAEIAIRASITGHLVLTSVHANSALGTVLRLIDMGLERHMVSYALIGALSQRLVRRICDGCRTPYKIDANTLARLCQQYGMDPKLFVQAIQKNADGGLHYLGNADSLPAEFMLYKGLGCDQCGGTGYKGRIGVFEVVQFTEELRDAIINKATLAEMENIASRNGFQSMAMDAIQKVKSGLVNIDDIYPILLEKSS